MVLGSEFTAGINIQMTENVVARLEAIEARLGPVTASINKMNEALGGVGNLRGVNKSLNQMSRNLDKINQQSGGLGKVEQHLSRVGRTAQRSTSHLKALGRELRSLIGGVAGIAGIGMGVGGIIQGMKSGLDFQAQLNTLGVQGASASQIERARNQSIALSQQYLVKPGESVHYVRFASGIQGGDWNAALGQQEGAARFNQVMRLNKVAGGDYAESALKMTEMMKGKITGEGIKEIQDDLAKVSYASRGVVPLQAIQTQLVRSGLSRVGADPLAALTSLTFFLQETMGKSGGGVAQGGVGTMRQAFQKLFVGGSMTAATQSVFAQAGLLEGYDEALAKKRAEKIAQHGGRGGHSVHRTRNVYGPDGKLISHEDGDVMERGKSGKWQPKTMTLTAAELMKFGVHLKNVELFQKDPVGAVYTILVPAIEKLYHLKQGAMIPGNRNALSDTAMTTMWTRFIPGGTNTVKRFITELGVYRQRVEKFQGQVAIAPGVDQTMKHPLAIQQRLERVNNAWEAFNDKIWSNKRVIEAVSKVADMTVETLKEFTTWIDPAMNFFARVGHWISVFDRAFRHRTTEKDAQEIAKHIKHVIDAFAKFGDWVGSSIHGITNAFSRLMSVLQNNILLDWIKKFADLVAPFMGGGLPGVPPGGVTPPPDGSYKVPSGHRGPGDGMVPTPPPGWTPDMGFGNSPGGGSGNSPGAVPTGKVPDPLDFARGRRPAPTVLTPAASKYGLTPPPTPVNITLYFNAPVIGGDDAGRRIVAMIKPELDRISRKQASTMSQVSSAGASVFSPASYV